jgi:hypothetical protein
MLRMRTAAADLALRTEVGFPPDLLDRLGDGTVDLAVLYAPQQRTGLRIDLLIEEKLYFVTTSPDGRMPTPDEYVYVDWGPEFSAQHGLAFPDLSGAGVSASLGPLGLEYLLASGGAGYFRGAVIRQHLAAGRLHLVKGAPQFLYPAYAVYSENADADLLKPALAALHEAVAGHVDAALAKPRRASRPRGAARRVDRR